MVLQSPVNLSTHNPKAGPCNPEAQLDLKALMELHHRWPPLQFLVFETLETTRQNRARLL